MPRSLEELRKAVQEHKKKGMFAKEPVPEQIDMSKVDAIVSKMKKKYAAEGVEVEAVGGKLAVLRSIIAEEASAKLKIQTVEELREFRSPFIRQLGNVYIALQRPLGPLMKLLNSLPEVKEVDFYLYSANMQYSAQQYIALSVSVAIIAGAVAVAAAAALMVATPALLPLLKVVIPIVAGLFTFAFAMVIMLITPKNRANSRGSALSAELPFALRHMGTELKAGIGLYKTLQTIAVADYGILSEEFARAINEIEEGTDTKDALRNLALRTQSRSLKMALMHVVRTLKTGGNLSEIMDDIAEDVSFELRMKIRDFSEKMNFFGVIFIVGAIVLPVFVAILSGIANTPLPMPLNFPPMQAFMFFVLVMPMMLAFLVFYLKVAQPKV